MRWYSGTCLHHLRPPSFKELLYGMPSFLLETVLSETEVISPWCSEKRTQLPRISQCGSMFFMLPEAGFYLLCFARQILTWLRSLLGIPFTLKFLIHSSPSSLSLLTCSLAFPCWLNEVNPRYLTEVSYLHSTPWNAGTPFTPQWYAYLHITCYHLGCGGSKSMSLLKQDSIQSTF